MKRTRLVYKTGIFASYIEIGKIITVTLFALLVVYLFSPSLVAQNTLLTQQTTFSTTASGVVLNLTRNYVSYYKITWYPLSAPAACAVQVDSSLDGVSWNSADVIASKTCTTNGNFGTSIAANYNYIRVRVTSLTTGTFVAIVLQGLDGPSTASGGITPATLFGVKCDGVTDNTVNLQNAINATYNKILLMPGGGLACITGPLTVTSAITIMGQGNFLATTIQARGLNDTTFSVTSGGSLVFTNVIFTSASRQTAGSYISLTGQGPNTNANSIIRDIVMDSCWICIDIGVVQGLLIDNVQLQNVRSRGVRTNNTTSGDLAVGQITSSKFASDSTITTAVGIEFQSGILNVNFSHFFPAFAEDILFNWGSSSATGTEEFIGNTFDFPVTAAVQLQRQGGATGTVAVLNFNGNTFTTGTFNAVKFVSSFIYVPTNAVGWLATLNVTGNIIYLGDSGGIGINLPSGGSPGPGQNAFIGSNTITDTDTLGVCILMGAGFTLNTIGANQLHCGTNYSGPGASLLATIFPSSVSTTGYQVNSTAVSGHYLRGNGTNYVDSAIQSSDVPMALVISGFDTAAGALTSPTVYASLYAGCCYSTAVMAIQPVAYAFTATHLSCSLVVLPSVGNSVFTLYKNGVATTLTVTFTSATTGPPYTLTDSSHTASFVAGDSLVMQWNSGTDVLASWSGCTVYQ